MTDSVPAPSSKPRRGGRALLWLLLLVLLAALGWRGWQAWQQHQQQQATEAQADDAHWRALETRLDALRDDQRAQAKRLARADATNRLLREEILGIGQRAALLEDSVDKLADAPSSGGQALRLDEAELLLSLGAQQLQLAGDLDAARHAYALAAGVLDALDDPALVDLHQALAQERAELEALGEDPKQVALSRLEAFADGLPALSEQPATPAAADQPWWKRAFARIVHVQPTDHDLDVAPDARAAGQAALQLEITLARSAAERRDAAGWSAALVRAGHWLPQLWPRSQALDRQLDALQALRKLPLEVDMPTLGSTLEQLRNLPTPQPHVAV